MATAPAVGKEEATHEYRENQIDANALASAGTKHERKKGGQAIPIHELDWEKGGDERAKGKREYRGRSDQGRRLDGRESDGEKQNK